MICQEGKPYDDLKETTQKMLTKFFQLCKTTAPQIGFHPTFFRTDKVELTVKPAWDNFLDSAKLVLQAKQANDEKSLALSLSKMDQTLNTLATIIKKVLLLCSTEIYLVRAHPTRR